MYSEGLGVPQDYGEALRWFRLAADQGDAAAQINIGYRYQYGEGVPQDHAEALRWFRKAADQGYAAAKDEIERMRNQGLK
jgi:TPR repeat protein